MAVFNLRAFDDHEQVMFCTDVESGLKAVIAVHSTVLGPAVGGCRMWNYNSDESALIDVLRLSRGMTYKNAMAKVPYGGGKSVIIGNPNTMKSEALFLAFGRFVNQLQGRYITAEDVAITTQDIDIIHRETDHVLGLESKSGDPSPITAYGTFVGIKAAVKHKLGIDSLAGIKVAVQGVGHVGYYLCGLLHQEGAELTVCDINNESVARVAEEFNAKVVATDDIYSQDVDVFAPCALGACLNDNTIPQIKAKVIAGAANNQLADDKHGLELMKRGILYAPDYVINAGGIINVSFEQNYHRETALKKVDEIYNTLSEVFKMSDQKGKGTNIIADEIARQRIADAKERQ